MKRKKSANSQAKEKKQSEVIGNMNLMSASEDEDLYLCFLNKKMRYFNKKLKEISDLEKQESELKEAQKEKISKKEQFLKDSAFFDQTKFLYSTFLKETNCPGIKLQKEQKLTMAEEQAYESQLKEKNLKIEQLSKQIQEQDHVIQQTIKKVIEARFLDQYYKISKSAIDHKVAEIIGPLRPCFTLNETELFKVQLSQSLSSLENYVNSNLPEIVAELIKSEEIANFSLLKKEENIYQQQNQQQQQQQQKEIQKNKEIEEQKQEGENCKQEKENVTLEEQKRYPAVEKTKKQNERQGQQKYPKLNYYDLQGEKNQQAQGKAKYQQKGYGRGYKYKEYYQPKQQQK